MRRLHSPKPGTIFLLLFLGATMADDDDREGFFHHTRYKQNLNSKIMITAIVSLIAVIFLVVILHIYARYLLRRRGRRGAAIRGVSFEFRSAQVQSEPPKTGLDAAVIALLPLFTFKDMDRPNESNNTECAVCLSSIDDEEMARLLPNCNHVFHVECIDMWLGSHSTCPICRTGAEPQSETETTEPVEGAPPTAPPMEAVNSTSSTSLEGTSGGAAAQSVKVGESGSRLSSFRRMLSRERSSRIVQSCGQGDGNLDDIERQ